MRTDQETFTYIPKKIVLYSWLVPKGGLAKVLKKECEYLTLQGFNVKLLTSEAIPKEYLEGFESIPTETLSANSMHSSARERDLSIFFPGLNINMSDGILMSSLKLFKLLNREKPYVVISHQLLSAILSIPFIIVYKKDLIVVLHDNPFMFIELKDKKGLFNRFENFVAYRIALFVFKHSKFIVSTTKPIQESLYKHIKNINNNDKKYQVLEYGIEAFPKRDMKDRKLLLTVSKWSKFRNPDLYLDILEKLPANIKLTFVGRWDSEAEFEDFILKIKKNNLQERIDVIRNISEDELNRLYDQTRLFLRLGFGEHGTGQGIIEALGHGCPVIISRELGASSLIENGKNGFLIDGNNLEKIIENISSIFWDDSILEDLSDAAYETARINGWEKYLRGILGLLT